MTRGGYFDPMVRAVGLSDPRSLAPDPAQQREPRHLPDPKDIAAQSDFERPAI